MAATAPTAPARCNCSPAWASRGRDKSPDVMARLLALKPKRQNLGPCAAFLPSQRDIAVLCGWNSATRRHCPVNTATLRSQTKRYCETEAYTARSRSDIEVNHDELFTTDRD